MKLKLSFYKSPLKSALSLRQRAGRILVKVLSDSKNTVLQVQLPVNLLDGHGKFGLVLWKKTVRQTVQVFVVEFPLLHAKILGVH